MCLVKIHKFPRISWKPIICYKVLQKRNNDYITPCVGYLIIKDREVIKGSESFFKGLKYKRINSWGVHAFTNRFDAFQMAAQYFCSYDQLFGGHVVVKCIIPRFTFYFKGKIMKFVLEK